MPTVFDDPADWRPGYPLDLRGSELAHRDALGPYGDFEARAARVVARAIGQKVVLQDDNRYDGTPDLRIEFSDGSVGVCEVVTASDPQRAEQTVAFGKGDLTLHSDTLSWTWWLTLSPGADRRRVKQSIVSILQDMERSNEQYPTLGPPTAETANVTRLRQLGVTEVACNTAPQQRAGDIIGLVEGIGGPLELDWAGFDAWLSGFLAEPIIERKRHKLAAAVEARERHIFVGVSWSVAWSVHRVLEQGVSELPPRAPNLPEAVTHLWLLGAEVSERCLAWSAEHGWFDAARQWKTA